MARSSTLDLPGTVLIIGFFAIATLKYIQLGFANKADNQFKVCNFDTTFGVWALIVAEFGGLPILFGGFLTSAFR